MFWSAFFRPDAREVSIKLDQNGSVVPAEKIQGEGLFQATLEKCPRDVPYTLKIKRWDGSEQITRDPYSYGVIMGEVTFIFSPKANIGAFTTNSVRIFASSVTTLAFTSRSGRRTRSASVWLGISMAGMAGFTPCAS
jgi:1,4-alpha-glucan branching enzyme